eukprot:m.41093 g.41093  ORF g.41093 m.41093 type:complete len:242 (+) comp11963_c0_seq4:21-746(+)
MPAWDWRHERALVALACMGPVPTRSFHLPHAFLQIHQATGTKTTNKTTTAARLAQNGRGVLCLCAEAWLVWQIEIFASSSFLAAVINRLRLAVALIHFTADQSRRNLTKKPPNTAAMEKQSNVKQDTQKIGQDTTTSGLKDASMGSSSGQQRGGSDSSSGQQRGGIEGSSGQQRGGSDSSSGQQRGGSDSTWSGSGSSGQRGGFDSSSGSSGQRGMEGSSGSSGQQHGSSGSSGQGKSHGK